MRRLVVKNMPALLRRPQTAASARVVRAAARSPVIVQRPVKQAAAIIPRPAITKTPAAAVAYNRLSPQKLKPVKQHRVRALANKPRLSGANVERIREIRGIGLNRCLIVVGNGPSVGEMPLDQLRGHDRIHTLSINTPDMRLWPTTYWVFFDPSQSRRHEALWSTYAGTIFNSTGIQKIKENTIRLANKRGGGFSFALDEFVHIGQSSVYAAMQIAHWMEYESVYLMGVDMCVVGDQLYFYGVNPDVKPEARAAKFKREATHYDTAARILTEADRKRFIFCSNYNPHGFVDKFGRLDHTKAVEAILARYGSKS
jgi:hypothetical protein